MGDLSADSLALREPSDCCARSVALVGRLVAWLFGLLFWFMDRFKTLTRDEVRAMLSFWRSIEETSGYQAIKDEGRDEGRAEGLLKAKTDDVTRLLTRRFGPLPEWAGARIAAADLPQLDTWIDGLLDAPSLTDLLGPADAPARH